MKKNLSKRLLALLLCVLMFVSLLPVSVLADEEDGTDVQTGEVLNTEAPETPDEPEAPEVPGTPEVPEIPDEPALALPVTVMGAAGDSTPGETEFSVEPVLDEAWNVDMDHRNAGITLPLSNDGVTMQVRATGENVRYQWSVNPDDSEVLGTSRDTDTLTLGQVTRLTNCFVTVSDDNGNEETWHFGVRLDNGLSVEPVTESGWTVTSTASNIYSVSLSLPAANEGVTLRVSVQAADMDGMSASWQISCGEDRETVADDGSFSYATGPVTADTDYDLYIQDRFGNPARVTFHITLSNGATQPTDYTDLTLASFPVTVSVDEGETVWYRLTPPAEMEYMFRTIGGWNVMLDLYDEDLNVVGNGVRWSSYDDSEKGASVRTSLSAGVPYYLAASSFEGGSGTVSMTAEAYNNFYLSWENNSWLEVDPGETVTLGRVIPNGIYLDLVSYAWYDPAGSLLGTGDTCVIENISCAGEYHCVAQDGLGNENDVCFTVVIRGVSDNNFSVEPVLQEGWTVDEDGCVQILLPVENDGVTLQVKASGSNLDSVTYDWSWSKYSADVISVVGDTIVLDNVYRRTYCSVWVDDGLGNWEEIEFFISLDNGLSLTPALADEWSWDGSETVRIVLPPENSGVTLQAFVQATDISDMKIMWHVCGFSDVFEPLEETGLTLETGPIACDTIYDLDLIDRFGNPAMLRFYIAIDDGSVHTPTDYTDLTTDMLPLAVAAAAGGTSWVRFVAPWDQYCIFRTKCASAYALTLDLYDEAMNALFEGHAYYVNDDGSGGAEVASWLYEGETYWLAVSSENGGAGDLTLEVQNYLDAWVSDNMYYGDLGDSITLGGIEIQGTVLGELRYSWYDPNGELLATTSEPWYTIASVQRGGQYVCVVSDGLSFDSQVTFYVRINNDLWLNQVSPGEVFLKPGEKTTLQTEVMGGGDRTGLSLQWCKEVYSESEGSQTVEIPGATGATYTLTFDGSPAEYCCRMTDRYGNDWYAWFSVKYQNHFSAEPVLGDGWTAAEWTQTAEITIPVNNSGVTLRVRATGDDLEDVKYSWYTVLDSAAEVLSGQGTDTLVLGPVTRSFAYNVAVSDKYGNTEFCYFSIGLDNGLSVSPVMQEGWTLDPYNGNVRITLPVENTGVTLAADVQADDTTDMEVLWRVETPSFSRDIEDAHSYSLETGAIRESCTYTLFVTDRYGNQEAVVFAVAIENGFSVEPAVPSDWNVYHDEEDEYYSISGRLPVDNNGVTLQFKVRAADKSRMKAWLYSNGDLELTPDDPAAEVWTYSYTVNRPITGAAHYSFYVSDGFGSNYTLYFDLSLENAFRATASDGSYQMRVSVANGAKATLKLNVTGNDLSKLRIDWMERGKWISGASNKTSYTTPAIKQNTVYQAMVDDGYGNASYIYFFVCVNNKLKISSTVGTDAPRGAIPARLVEVGEGGDVTLKVTAGATTVTGMKINWYDSYPTRNYMTDEYVWNSSPVLTTSGTSSSFPVSNVRTQQTYFAQAVDKFGNTALMQFDVQVKNDLRAYAAGTTEEVVQIRAVPFEPLTLSVDVSAVDKSGLVIQWSCEDGMLDPAGGTSYTIPSVEKTQHYTCNVIDRFGNRTPVSFYVIADNHLSVEPEGGRYTVALRAGETARMVIVRNGEDGGALQGGDNELPICVNADDLTDLSVTWLRLNQNRYLVPVEFDGTLLLSEPVDADAGAQQYNLIVTDRFGNASRFSIRIELDNHLSVTINKTLVAVASGKKATLKVSVTADDAAGLSYQWFGGEHGTLIEGATKASYTTPAIKKQTQYSCLVTDRFGNTAWAGATVQVQNKLMVTPVQAEQYVAEGGSAVMEVKVTAKSLKNLKYQWYRITGEGLDLIPDATEARYAVENVTRSQEYYCEVTDNYSNTDGAWFLVAIDNGFDVTIPGGGNEYTFFKGLSGTLPVCVTLNDAADYSGRWTIQKKDNGNLSWQPVSGSGIVFENADGVWRGSDSYTRVWDTEGSYLVRYGGVDKTGTVRGYLFNVTVLTLKDYAAPAPTLAKTPEGVSVSFDAVPDVIATTYMIERKAGTGKFAPAATLGLTDLIRSEDCATLTWVDTTVKNNTKYSYRVQAVKGTETSLPGAASAALTAYLPPVLKDAVQQTNGVTVSWAKVAGASAYRVFRSVEGEWSIVAQKVTGTSFTDKTAVSGSVNSYRVCALDKKGNMISAPQNESVEIYYLTAPVITAVLGPDGAELGWEAVQGATGYRVERKTGKGAFETIEAAEAGIGYLDEALNLTSGTSYSYRVTALGAQGESEPSASKSVTYYKAPTLQTAEATASGVKLTWAKGTSAAKYSVWRSVDGVAWEVAATKLTKLTWTDTAVGYGRTAFYRVQSLNKSGVAVSEGSNVLSVTNDLFLPMPAVLSAKPDYHGVTVEWSVSDGAEIYEVMRKTGTGAWTVVCTATAGVTSFKDESVQNKTAYSYTVRALTNGGQLASKYDTAGKKVTYYEAPELVSVTAAEQGATVTWQKSAGAVKYRVLCRDDAESEWTVLAKAVSGTSYNDKSAQPGRSYTVQALDKNGKVISGFDPDGLTYGEAASVYTLNFYHIFASEEAGGLESRWINRAIEEIKTRSGGRLVINCVPGGIMGSEAELIPLVCTGTLDMSLTGPSVWGVFSGIDALGWTELPYVVDNYAQLTALCEILPELTNRQLEQAGVDLYCLGAMSQGIRCLCTTENFPVYTVDDCSGLRIRVPQSDVYMAAVEGWGCVPTAMSASQVISGLANGVIEGFDSDPASITARGQQESFRWYIETNHVASPNLLMINKSSLEQLPADLQEILISVFQNKSAGQCHDRVSANQTELEVIKAAGVEVITPTAEAFAGFKAADTPYRDAKIAEWGVGAIFNEALAYVAANA